MTNKTTTPHNEGLLSSLNKLRALFTRRDKIGFVILLVGMIIGAGLETFSIGIVPAFISVAISPDKIMQYEPAEAILEFLGITTSRDILLWGCVGLLAVFTIKTGYICFQYYLQIRYTQNRRFRLTRRLFTAYMSAPYQFHLQRNSAELFRNTVQEVAEIMGKVLMPMLALTMHGMMMLAILALLFVAQPVMALVATLVLGFAGGGYQWLIKQKLIRYSRQAQEHRMHMIKAIQQGLGVIKELRVLNREKNFVKAMEHSLWQTIKAIRFQGVTQKITAPYMEFVAVFGLLSIAILLMLMGRGAESIAPTLALFAVAFVRLKASIGQVVGGINQLRFGVVSINPVYDDLMLLEKKRSQPRSTASTPSPEAPLSDQECSPASGSSSFSDNGSSVRLPLSASQSDSSPLPLAACRLPHDRFPLTEAISLKNIWYRYPDCQEYALKDINLTIPRGHSVAFVGQTGSGKTTLVDVILGLLEPEHGQVCLDGRDILNDLPAWQKNIGYIPQFIYLTDDTIRHNIALGINDKEIDEHQLWEAVRAAQLESFVHTLPQGIETVIGERGIKLSGGQRQRIGIARALYHQPEVLIMDEATSALDNATENAVIASIDELKGQRTIIMIAHRLTTVQNCDQLYYMKNGHILCGGTYTELIMNYDDFRSLAQVS